MKRIFLVFVAIFLITSPCLAYSVPDDTIVYVTNTGTKYHREGCSYLHSSRAMTIKRAEASGYGPCSRCDPDQKTGEYVSTWAGDSSGKSNSTSRPTPTPTIEPAPDSTNAAIEEEGERIGLVDIVAFVAFIFFFGLPCVLTVVVIVAGFLSVPIKFVRSKARERKSKLKWEGPALIDLLKEPDNQKGDYWLVNEKGKKIYADNPEELSKKVEEEAHSN